MAVGGIKPLAVYGYLVGGVVVEGGLIESRFRLEIAHTERNAPMPEAVTHYGQQTVHINGILESLSELFGSAALQFKSLP